MAWGKAIWECDKGQCSIGECKDSCPFTFLLTEQDVSLLRRNNYLVQFSDLAGMWAVFRQMWFPACGIKVLTDLPSRSSLTAP